MYYQKSIFAETTKNHIVYYFHKKGVQINRKVILLVHIYPAAAYITGYSAMSSWCFLNIKNGTDIIVFVHGLSD